MLIAVVVVLLCITVKALKESADTLRAPSGVSYEYYGDAEEIIRSSSTRNSLYTRFLHTTRRLCGY